MRGVCVGALCLVLTATARAEIQQALVTPTSDGEWNVAFQAMECIPETMAYTYTVKVPVTAEETVQVNGKEQTRTVTKYVEEQKTALQTVTKSVCRLWAAKVDPARLFAVSEVGGRKLTAGDVKKRINGPTLVLWTCGGDALPDYYATVFKPGTLFVQESGGAQAPSPHGAPVPTPGPQSLPLPLPVPQPVRPSVPQPTTEIRGTLSPAIQTVAFPPSESPGRIGLPQLPSLPAPQIVFAGRDGADLVKIRQFQETKSTTTVTIRVNDSSVSPEKQLTAMQTVRHSVTTPITWSVLRASTPDGSDLQLDRVKERLGSGESTVLLSADGQRVDPFWLENIQPKTLVLRGIKLMPASIGHYASPPIVAPAMPMPAPQPAQPAPPPQAVEPSKA